MMLRIGWCFWLLAALPGVFSQAEEAEHRDFQYNSIVDPKTGRYNFAYDTGHDSEIAHSLHMQYQDANGIVRGRYGYTDPRGKLRMVEYEAGPNGFIARGDVGPDQYPHGDAPAAPQTTSGTPQLASYSNAVANDFDLDPAPVQMAGWNPEEDPMKQSTGDSVVSSGDVESASTEQDSSEYTTENVTSRNALEVYGPELGFYNNRNPDYVYTDLSEISSLQFRDNDVRPTEENQSSNIYNIDVDPNEIRAADRTSRSADDNTAAQTGSQPIRVPVYTRHYHPNSHDHDAEQRYYRARQTHDHDAEQRYYRAHHDHDAERQRYYASRQTHDHDAEMRSRWVHANHNHRPHVYSYRLGHSHDYRSHYYPRRIFYRDSHSMEPHEHFDNPVYQNYRDHQHADVHLYARYRNNDYPATAKPYQLHYIPSDKYHDKEYHSEKS